MKKLLFFSLSLQILIINFSLADNLSGNELWCQSKFDKYPYGIKFITKKRAEIYSYSDEDLSSIKVKYHTKPKAIYINGKYQGAEIDGEIDRESLISNITGSINGVGTDFCELSSGVKIKINYLYKENVKKLKKNNKL